MEKNTTLHTLWSGSHNIVCCKCTANYYLFAALLCILTRLVNADPEINDSWRGGPKNVCHCWHPSDLQPQILAIHVEFRHLKQDFWHICKFYRIHTSELRIMVITTSRIHIPKYIWNLVISILVVTGVPVDILPPC